MKNNTSGLACNLTVFDAQQRAHFPAQTQALIADAQKIRELEDGFALQFVDHPEQRVQIEAFIEREGQCCSFLDFALTCDAMADRIWLHITGGDGVKEFLQIELANMSNQEGA